MKVRIISALVAIALAVLVLFFLPTAVFYIVISLISGLAGFELVRVVKKECHPAMLVGAVIAAGAAPLCGLFDRLLWASLLLLAFGLFLTLIQVFNHTQPVTVTAYVFFVTLYAAFTFFCVGVLRGRENGLYYVVLALLIPWLSDTGAYFTGTFLGKHKMCPAVSPKKTWEGFVGGWIFSVLASVGATLLYWWIAAGRVDMVIVWQVALTALIVSPVSVVGDLFTSVIKRQYNIKDMGTIMPGHGGVMDRFDSVCLSAPVVLVLVQLMPLVK